MKITPFKALESLGIIPNNSAQKIEAAAKAICHLEEMGLKISPEGRTTKGDNLVHLTTAQDRDVFFLNNKVLNTGNTILEAYQNLLRQISGHTLIERIPGATQKEYKIPRFNTSM